MIESKIIKGEKKVSHMNSAYQLVSFPYLAVHYAGFYELTTWSAPSWLDSSIGRTLSSTGNAESWVQILFRLTRGGVLIFGFADLAISHHHWAISYHHATSFPGSSLTRPQWRERTLGTRLIITKSSGKLYCLVKETLCIRVRKPTLNVQTDSIRAKVFV